VKRSQMPLLRMTGPKPKARQGNGFPSDIRIQLADLFGLDVFPLVLRKESGFFIQNPEKCVIFSRILAHWRLPGAGVFSSCCRLI
jgi:hypothetical protein